MSVNFIHLRARSAYSLSEGAIKIDKLIELCLQNNMPAIALTDSSNLFGALEFSLKCCDAGIQPIIGCTVNVAYEKTSDQLLFLVKNEIGYNNLMKIVSMAHLQSSSADKPEIKINTLNGKTEGLIALTGGVYGYLNKLIKNASIENAAKFLKELENLFPSRLYIELMRHDDEPDDELIQLAHDINIPLVATGDVYYSTPDFHEAHDALMCIAQGVSVGSVDRKTSSKESYFKSSKEMKKLFEDVPEAVINTEVIAKRCAYCLKPKKVMMPSITINENEELEKQALLGLKNRIAKESIQNEQKYFDRLKYELSVINKIGFSGYFLIIADFVQWAKKHDIPVGPGRGSGAGSIVAWSLLITDVDPIKFNLLFERFLNPERVSMPDFDIDFCQDRRDEVIKYVQQKYGHDKVAQIITFGKLQARAVLRDVGRVLGMPYGQVDKICKLIPYNPVNPPTLFSSIESEPAFRKMMDEDDQVEKLINLALKLEGLYRHASTHAAGVVIADRPLEDVVPLYKDPHSDMPVTQFNMKFIESAGLIKFDFLGLKTLTVISKTIELLKKRNIIVNIQSLPLNDEKTFEMLRHVETVGVFQLDSSGMKNVIKNLRPDRFEDLVALVALYRPGPMDDIPKYIACKHGDEPVKYLHPDLEKILSETHGVMVYQEQVTQIAQVIGGYTPGQADILRRAMGKKDRKEMEAQSKRFIEGAIAKGVSKSIAKQLFEQMEKFAGYGFNKSHSVPYALISYQTAYLKAHYPIEFMAAMMSLELSNTEKLAYYRQELRYLNIELLPPDVQKSLAEFSVEKNNNSYAIRYGLAAIKGTGIAAMNGIVNEREKNGIFKNINDFSKRIDHITRRQLEGLICSGAFDSLHNYRQSLLDNLDKVFSKSKSNSAQSNLFSEEDTSIRIPEKEWQSLEKLQKEFQALGFYLSSHPMESYKNFLKQLNISPINVIPYVLEKNQTAKIAGIVLGLQIKIAKSGNKFAFIQISDQTMSTEIVVFSDILTESRDIIREGNAILATVSGRVNGEDVRLVVKSIEDLNSVASQSISKININLESEKGLLDLKEILSEVPQGNTRIVLLMNLGDKKAKISLPNKYKISLKEFSAISRLDMRKAYIV